MSNYERVQATNVFGTMFTGDEPDDDFLLTMAKIGVVVHYMSDENNDYEGATLALVQVKSYGMTERFEYGPNPSRILWAQNPVGGGCIIRSWDSDAQIAWEFENE